MMDCPFPNFSRRACHSHFSVPFLFSRACLTRTVLWYETISGALSQCMCAVFHMLHILSFYRCHRRCLVTLQSRNATLFRVHWVRISRPVGSEENRSDMATLWLGTTWLSPDQTHRHFLVL